MFWFHCRRVALLLLALACSAPNHSALLQPICLHTWPLLLQAEDAIALLRGLGGERADLALVLALRAKGLILRVRFFYGWVKWLMVSAPMGGCYRHEEEYMCCRIRMHAKAATL